MKTEKNFFAKQLRNIMFEKNLTQKELASLAKTKQERISEWMNGVRNPSLSSIEKISHVLGVDINYFIENKSVNFLQNKNISDSKIQILIESNNNLAAENEKFKKEINFLKKEIEEIKTILKKR